MREFKGEKCCKKISSLLFWCDNKEVRGYCNEEVRGYCNEEERGYCNEEVTDYKHV